METLEMGPMAAVGPKFKMVTNMGAVVEACEQFISDKGDKLSGEGFKRS